MCEREREECGYARMLIKREYGWILDMERVMKVRVEGEDDGAEVIGVVTKKKHCQSFHGLGIVYFWCGHRSSLRNGGRELPPFNSLFPSTPECIQGVFGWRELGMETKNPFSFLFVTMEWNQTIDFIPSV